MITVAIVTRRLKPGKTYEDFRQAWFHTVGFGTKSKLLTMINVDDPQEIIVMGFIHTSVEDFKKQLETDIKERLANSLDDVIEPDNIDRKFGLLRAEDDFSADGDIAYHPAMIDGEELDDAVLMEELQQVQHMIAQASAKRDKLKADRDQ